MELTVMNKRRYDELVGKITNLELEIAKAHTQLRAIQDSNNNFAEIAFDENKFTDALLNRCEEAAREAARDTIDIDDITSEVTDNIDVSDLVERAVNDLELMDADSVNDKIQEYISDNSIMDSDDVENRLDEFKDDIIREVIQAITNKLTAEKGESL